MRKLVGLTTVATTLAAACAPKSDPFDRDGVDEISAALACVPEKALEVASSFEHSCARLQGGRVKCWGNNVYGQLGLGDPKNRGDALGEMGNNLPIANLGSGRTAVHLAMGQLFSCAVLDNGTVKC